MCDTRDGEYKSYFKVKVRLELITLVVTDL